jgi:plastocyanin
MKSRTYTLLLITAVTAALVTGCGGGGGGGGPSPAAAPSAGGSPSTSSSISINDFKFSPRAIRVPASAQIKVTNNDSAPHTVTADDGRSFDSGTVNPGASTSFQAPAPGSYAYHCTIHPFMKGTLLVK